MENDMEKIRLQKILSDSGVCSRRKAEELISAGEVYVNGRKAKLGDKANERDVIMVGGERVRYTKKRRKIYIMLNKPRGYVTTMADELDRKCVTELLTGVDERVYPVGRLDRNSEGLLLFTNDGNFANDIMHPSRHISKTYRVTVHSKITDDQIVSLTDGVELDVHLSSDGKLMVIHDETVDRTSNGMGRVVDMTCQELKKLDFSNGMPGYKDVRIPTLKEVYGLLKNTNLTINVEIKCDVVIYYGIWDKVIELEREMGMQGRIIYSSFNHYVLMKLREVDPKAKIGLLYSEAMVDPWVYANYLHADAIHPHYLAALGCPGLIEGCKKAGVEIHPWTCNDEQVVCDLASAGIEAVITNYPDKAREAIENR